MAGARVAPMIGRWRRSQPALRPEQIGPFDVGRAAYFARRWDEVRQRRADAGVRLQILESNRSVEAARLADIGRRRLVEGHDRPAIDRAEEFQRRHVADIDRELERQRRRRRLDHADRLVEWELEHGGRRPPSPGEYLLARRSKKPFPRHPTA